MNKKYRPSVHPGDVLQDEINELGITQAKLAEHIGVLPKTINEICRSKRGISAEMALRLACALGTSPEFWLNLQNNWELSLIDEKVYKTIKKVSA